MNRLPIRCLQTRRRRAAGRSVVELMISLAIASVILGAVLLTVTGTRDSGRRQDAQGVLSEEGAVALNLITSHLRMSGSLLPRAGIGLLKPDLNHLVPSQALLPFGCRNGFADPAAAVLTCGAGGFGDAIAVRYEADTFNTIPRGGQPTDCLGRVIPQTVLPGVGPGRYADNRFYVANNPDTGNPALFCTGSGGAPQVLVDNVETMRIQYGLLPEHEHYHDEYPLYVDNVGQYVDADDAMLTDASQPHRWRRVGAIRVCLLLRTNDGVAQEPTRYQDCNGNMVNAADRRLRRAMFATVYLRDGGAPGF